MLALVRRGSPSHRGWRGPGWFGWARLLVFITGRWARHGFAPTPSRSHARHSGLSIRTMFGAFRKALRRRSSTEIRLMVRATRRAFLTVVRDTPATSAISL